jgi:hypothetical protein
MSGDRSLVHGAHLAGASRSIHRPRQDCAPCRAIAVPRARRISPRGLPIPALRPRRKPFRRPAPCRAMAPIRSNSRLGGDFELSPRNLLLPSQGSVASTPRDEHDLFGGRGRRGSKESEERAFGGPRHRKAPRSPSRGRRPPPNPRGRADPLESGTTFRLTRGFGLTKNPAPPTGRPRLPLGKQRSLKTG